MFLEFAAGSGYLRRHVFSQQDDDVFELIPADTNNPLYNDEALWSPNSHLHTNTCRVLLRKSEAVKYIWQHGEGSETPIVLHKDKTGPKGHFHGLWKLHLQSL